ncbi:membrane protein [Chlamydia trachomatis]|uniref:Pmp family polymorphic membrane protein autotransporter adhesin n=1 Tax=Chlamydia trachomatis TaxID=813 RepID=UPI00038DD013|nr:Pmp family polymorphic membrane protein autotransporter adhesin [Chlamydia trachomatis]AGT71793.1 membrane protein [Chlamydia trachomatis]
MNRVIEIHAHYDQRQLSQSPNTNFLVHHPYLTLIPKFLLGALIVYAPYSFAEMELAISGHKQGKDRDTFTMISSCPEGTNYIINRKLILSDFSLLNKVSSGGAFRNLAGKISFLGKNSSASIHFKHININGFGAGVFSESSIEFTDLRKLVAFGSESTGGIFTAKEDISFKNNHHIAFRNNITKGNGGVIQLQGDMKGSVSFVDQRGAIIFTNNQAVTSSSMKHSGRGGAISGDFAGSRILFLNNQQITFEGNSAVHGGAIYNKNGLVEFLGNAGPLAFKENTTIANGGAIYTSNFKANQQTSPILFSQNHANKKGGAIYAQYVNLEQNQDTIRFEKNTAKEGGGAITSSQCSITAHNTITFSDNAAGDLGGGAILLEGKKPSLTLIAHSGNIAFSGNTMLHITKKASLDRHNSILIKEAPYKIQLAANKNHSIHFFDPVMALSASSSPIQINAPEYETPFFSPKGMIVFSGANLLDDAREDVANRTSIFNQPVHLYNGTLSIENGAHLIVQSFKQTGGRISLSPGSSLALYTMNSFFHGNISSKEPLEINGLSFGVDISPSNLQAEIRAGNAPLRLSGSPSIHDPEGLFYENRDTAASPYQMEILLTSDKTVDISKFTTDSLVTNKQSGFQGAWHFSWQPNTINNTKQKILRASWLPTGEYVLESNRVGRAVPNSLWSTFLLLQTASHNLGDHLCNNRSLIPTSYFGVLIGGTGAEMSTHSSEEESFISRLGATGTSIIRLAPSLTLSGGGSHMFGDSFVADLPEHITSEGIVQNVGLTHVWGPLTVNSTLCAALDHNAMVRICSKKDHTYGKWDTFGMRGTLGASYTFLEYDQTMRVFSFANIEATNILQRAFTETGYNPRSFSKTKLLNIAIPIGIGYEFCLGNSSFALLGKGSIGYSRDIKRENPSTLAHLAMNDFAWTTNGCSVPTSAHTLANQLILRYKACSLYITAYTINREGKNLSNSLSCGGYVGF